MRKIYRHTYWRHFLFLCVFRIGAKAVGPDGAREAHQNEIIDGEHQPPPFVVDVVTTANSEGDAWNKDNKLIHR